MSIIIRAKKYFWSSTVCLFLNAACILFMPLASQYAKQTSNLSLLITGILFWLLLISGYILFGLANSERKYFIRRRYDGDYSMGCHCGIITFFSSIPASVADSVMIASAVLLLIICLINKTEGYLIYIVLFLLTMSVNMHCLFNGRVYKVTKIKRMRREESHE